jgi:protein arginine kinase
MRFKRNAACRDTMGKVAMSKVMLDNLLRKPLPFFSGSQDGIVIYSKLSLMRNLQDFNFPAAASEEVLKQIRHIIKEAVITSGTFGKDALLLDWETLSETDKAALAERRLADHEFFLPGSAKAIFIRADEKFHLAVNNRNHLTLQTISPGMQWRRMWQNANKTDDRLNQHLAYAFDEHLGYLAPYPADMGTGLRLSALLHLPALSIAGDFSGDIDGFTALNTTLSDPDGNALLENGSSLYLLSSNLTIDDSEEEMISGMEKNVAHLCALENNACQEMLEKDPTRLLDYVGRAYGNLCHCYKISAEEAVESIFRLRFGVKMGIFRKIDYQMLCSLLNQIGDAHIRRELGGDISDMEAEIHRAQLCRNAFNQK